MSSEQINPPPPEAAAGSLGTSQGCGWWNSQQPKPMGLLRELMRRLKVPHLAFNIHTTRTFRRTHGLPGKRRCARRRPAAFGPAALGTAARDGGKKWYASMRRGAGAAHPGGEKNEQ